MILAEERHSQWEAWLYLNDAGQLMYHFENDGHAALRHGRESQEEIWTLEEAVRHFPGDAEKIRAAVSARKSE